MVNAFPFLLPFELSDIGKPLAAGCLYTYALGTSDPKPTYSDSAGTVFNTNPIILNAAGRFRCYLAPGGYTFVLRDSLGNLIWSEPYLNNGGGAGGTVQVLNSIADLRAAGAGSTAYAFVMGYYEGGDIGPRTYKFDAESSAPDDGGGVIAPDSGTGRWILEWDGKPIDVRAFGAKGDGINDDSVPVLKAQTWALAKNLKSGIDFTHVPVFYNMGSDVVQITAVANVQPGGQIRPAASGISFQGGLNAGPYRIFYGDGFVNGVDLARVYSAALPEWFGARGEGATIDDFNNLDAIGSLFAAFPPYMAFLSPLGYYCSAAVYEVLPNPGLILAVGDVKSDSETFVPVGVYTSGKFIATSAEFVTALITTLTATTANITTANIGTANVTTILNALAAAITNDLAVGGAAVIGGALTAGPAKVRGGSSAALGAVPSSRYTNPVAVNNVGATEQPLRSFAVVANILNVVGAEIEFEAFGSFAANTNTKTVKLTIVDTVPIESLLIAAAIAPGSAVAYSWEMKGKIVIRNSTQYLLYGKARVYRVSTNEAVIAVSATGALADTSLAPIPNPTVVQDGTVTVTPTVVNIIKGAIGIITPGITFNQALSVRLLAQGAASNDITVDYFKVQLTPAP